MEHQKCLHAKTANLNYDRKKYSPAVQPHLQQLYMYLGGEVIDRILRKMFTTFFVTIGKLNRVVFRSRLRSSFLRK